MTRLTRLVLMVGSVMGLGMVAPAPIQAGLIPWVYDSIFGPVGSVQARRAYRYGTYNAGYAPMSVAYAPTGYGSYGSGCSSCNQQSSYYPPSTGYDTFYGNYQSYSVPQSNCCAPCSSCSSGNCAPGQTCTNCSANSPPIPAGYGSNTSGYGSNPAPAPTPDPYNSRDVNGGSREILNRLNELEHRVNEDEKFLKRKHQNDYQIEPYNRQSTYGETVPARRKSISIDSNSADPNDYPLPRTRRDPAPANDVINEESRKPELTAPPVIDDKGIDKNQATDFKETEPQALRFQNRATSHAVAPRERMAIFTKQSKTAIANSNKPSIKTSSESSRSPELARN